MGEWLNPVAWNAAVGQPTEGSNPSLSTIKFSLNFKNYLYAFSRVVTCKTKITNLSSNFL